MGVGDRGHPDPYELESAFSRARLGLLLLLAILVSGTGSYWALGLSPFDAAYQTLITISTVGYREVGDSDGTAYRLLTMVLIVLGVGTALYTFGTVLETLVEGRLNDRLWRRRMDRRIAAMSGHVIVCGWGRVGREIARHIEGTGTDIVVIDREAERLSDVGVPHVLGDATDDDVLAEAGIERAGSLVAALDTDAANLYVTLSGRSSRPDLFIVARARVEAAEAKLTQAGANRVVNPQQIGGARIAAMILQPSVADFLDVVMHDGSLEFRLAEVVVPPTSTVVGRSLRDAALRDRTGALVLAVRGDDGEFRTNPTPDEKIAAGEVLIAMGTDDQLAALRAELTGPAR